MKRAAVIGIVAGAAIAAVGVAAILWAVTGPRSADDTAEAYLKALSQGDAHAVAGLLRTPPDEVERIEEAFSGATSYISDYSYEMYDDHSVRAEVTLGGESAVIGFVLDDGADGFAVSSDYLATLEVATTIGDMVEIGGAVVPAKIPVSLLPAVYAVAALPAKITTGETTVAVSNEAPVAVTLEAQLSPDATTLAQKHLDAYADMCAASEAVPEHCGLRVPWAADLATLDAISFRIGEYPTLTLSGDATRFAASGGVVFATATGTRRDGGSGTFTYRDADWTLRGTVTLTAETMELAVD